MSDIRERTVSGAVWSVASQLGRQSALLVTNVVLARLLTPRDFGLVATVLVFVNFAFVIAEQGFGAALIRLERLEERHLSTTWWTGLGLGALMTLAFLVGAPLVARLYGEPELEGLTRLMAWAFAINAVGMVHSTLLARELAFKSLAKAEISSAWLGGAVGVACAAAGWGAWSIVVQTLVTAVAGAAALWFVCPWRPRVLFDGVAARELVGFSSALFVGNAANYWVRNVDNLLIGYRLGQRELGIYGRAYAVMLFPLSRITRVLSRVLFPSMSLQLADTHAARRMFLRMSASVAVVTFPMMLGVAASAREFVACVFGPNWGEMVPVLRVLCLVGMAQSVSLLLWTIFLSHGTPAMRLRVVLPLQALQALAIVLGLRGGIEGVAKAYALAALLSIPVEAHFAGRLIGMSLREFLSEHSGIFACALAMALGVSVGSRALSGVDPFLSFGALALGGAGAYLLMLRLFGVRAFSALLKEVRHRVPESWRPA